MTGGGGGCDNPFQSITAILENVAEPKHDFGGDRANYSAEYFKKYKPGSIGEWGKPPDDPKVAGEFCYDYRNAIRILNNIINL